MRTIEKNIYSFNELTEEAKAKAIDNHRIFIYENEHFLAYDIRSLFDVIGGQFNCNWDSFDVANNDINVTYSFSDNISELSGIRALKWLENNFFPFVEKPKFLKCFNGKKEKWPYRYRKYGKGINGIYTLLYSTIFVGIDCPFTGFCYDYDFIRPFIEFRKKPNDTTIQELFESGFYSVIKSANAEYEHSLSDEAIIDTILANEYEFYEDGALI
jgi:hypothetical protein